MLQMIRSRPDLADIRVIMISGLDANDETRTKGADGFSAETLRAG